MGWTAESPPISRSTLDQKGEPLTEPVKHHLVLEHESQGNTIELNKSFIYIFIYLFIHLFIYSFI